MTDVLPSSHPTVDRDVDPATTRSRSRHLPRPVGFWVVAAATATLLAASSAPSPLYAVYQRGVRLLGDSR